MKGILILLSLICLGMVQADKRQFYELKGQEIKPPMTQDYRAWEMVGRSVVHDLENLNRAIFPGIHLIYQDPISLRIFRDQGLYPDGTTIIMEVWPLSRTEAESGFAWFPNSSPELLIQIKDRRVFSGDGWSYYRVAQRDLEGGNKWLSAQPGSACQSCHAASASQDQVFLNYYPLWGRN
ncbi:MAG: cytochrome P460 family protein [Acidobacteria bacterium]|nr:cytochrome P460 family protein [Acidobacteriota bacterium]